MPRGTVRYYAAARDAAGLAEESYDAPTLAAALDSLRARHDARFATVVGRCSFVVDSAPVGGRDHSSVGLSEGGTVEVLPPFAGGASLAERGGRDSADRGARRREASEWPGRDAVERPRRGEVPGRRRTAVEASARRPAPLGMGALSAAVFGILAAGSAVGRPVLAAGLVAVQLLVILGWLALVDAPAAEGAFLVAAAAALGADAVLLVDTDDGLQALSAVLGLALLAALLHQLARRRRRRVTESLAGTLTSVVLAVAAAPLLALRGLNSGRDLCAAVLAAAAAGLLAGRLVDTVLRRPALADGASRGWPGLVVALAAGAAAASAVVDRGSLNLDDRAAALLGLAVAGTVAAADLAADLGAAELREGARDARRVSALRPVGVLLPVVALGPVAYLAGRSLAG